MTQREMFDKNIGLAYSTLNWFCKKRGLFANDYKSVALEGLWEACSKFDPEKGFTFGTFAWSQIKFRLMSFVNEDDLRKRTWGKRKIYTNLPSRSLRLIPSRQNETEFDDYESVKELFVEVLSVLDERQQTILQLRVQGNALHVVGDKLGVTKERIRQLECRAMRDLRNSKKVGELLRHLEDKDDHTRNIGRRKYFGEEENDNPWQSKALRDWEDSEDGITDLPPA